MPHAASGPTLAQVARLAGVSVPTASRVANGRENVSPSTRLRVEEAMRRAGYVRRHRLRPASPLVDIVVPDLSHRWTTEILRGAEEAATREGLSMVVSAGVQESRSGRPAGGWLDALNARGTAGVLFTATDPPPVQQRWMAHHAVPHVLIEPVVDPPPGVPAIRTADRAGGHAAAEHLLNLGHRDIAVIASHNAFARDTERMAGYRSALAAAGVEVQARYLRHAGSDQDHAYRAAHDLLVLQLPPTAVLACSAGTAAALYRAAALLGVRIPQDMSVVGFDDLPGQSGKSGEVPALTAVEHPVADMAAWGMCTLVAMMHGETVATGRNETPPCLVVRRSTAPRPY